jgi:hypothetical protein
MKNNQRTVVCFMSLLLLIVCAGDVSALDPKSEKAIKAFLSSQESEQQGTESQGSAVADLNSDGKDELILVWTLLGPTFWQDNLTVFVLTPKGYKDVATLLLEGEAGLASVQNGIILLDHKLYAAKDPKCCPSLKKQLKYHWSGKKIEKIQP